MEPDQSAPDQPAPHQSQSSPSQADQSAPASQLVLDLPVNAVLTREDFFVSPTNQAAVCLIDAWPAWHQAWAMIVGPAGSGKTHLAKVWAARAGARVLRLQDLRVEDVPLLLGRKALAVECNDGRDFDEAALFHLINLASQDQCHVLMTARIPPALWVLTRQDLESRLKAIPLAELQEPDDSLLHAVMAKLFRDRQVAVDPAVITYLTARMERSLDCAETLVDRLDRAALERKRPITTRLAGEILSTL